MRDSFRRSPGGIAVLLVALAFGPLQAASAAGQEVTSRTPNLAGGWVGSPGTLHFNFLHRFFTAEAGDETKLQNSPTLLLAGPVHERILLGAQYGSNSLVGGDKFNEWELFARWAPLPEGRGPVEVALTGAYNMAAESADGELSVALPTGPVRLLGAARAFSDARGTGDQGFGVAGGAVFRVSDGVALAGDVGTTWIDGESGDLVWGAALQLRIPTTPHTFSIQASNTRTGTIQGSSLGLRTVWGFEFTVPITLARYFPRDRAPAAAAVAADPGADEVEVTMTDDFRYMPEVIEVRAGQTVVWRNTTQLPHTVTAHPERVRDPDLIALPDGAEPFDSGNMFAGDVFRHTFTVPGEYVYLCIPHEMVGMVGRVVVVP